MTRTLFIGIDEDGRAVGWNRVLQQIAAVERLECGLVVQGSAEHKLCWADFNDADDPTTLFQRILRDREAREAMGMTLMQLGALPPYAAVTVDGKRAVRLEYHERTEFRAAS